MRSHLTVLILLCSTLGLQAQQQGRPKIGLTLSGGGAKGLAHIGILMAIDSAGLKVDYVTGTSMGSIAGALYAAGYSGKEIENLAKKIDWQGLLSNSSPLPTLTMMEKDDNNKYVVELPRIDKKFKLPGGFLESQELWLKLSEVFFPVFDVKDFSKLPRSFKCLATDVFSRDAVVLDSGDIVSAIRASMAIPSVFTPVEYNGRLLVDGGIVRNFPVSDVKKMGAQITIGSDVSPGLMTRENITTASQIMQMIYFREDESAQKERDMCDIYVHQPMAGYSSASFSSSNEIIELGKENGRKILPRLKQLADSLSQIYGPATSIAQQYRHSSIFIPDYEINGVSEKEADLVVNQMRFNTNRRYSAKELATCIRRAFGTGYFRKMTYSLEPLNGDTAKVIFNIELTPLVTARFALHINSFLGNNAIINLTARKLGSGYSKSQITVNAGEHLRFRAEHMASFGKRKNISVKAKYQHEEIKINTYENFNKVGVYKQRNQTADVLFQFSGLTNTLIGMGVRHERLSFKPQIALGYQFKGGVDFINSYIFLSHNTLSNAIYPKSGTRIGMEAGCVFNQHPDYDVLKDNAFIGNQDAFGGVYKTYIATKLNIEQYVPLSGRTVLLGQIQSGVNLNNRYSILNDFYIGGLNPGIRNQITFAGLQEGTVISPSVAALQAGLRYECYNNLFLTAKTNGLYYNFIGSDNKWQSARFMSGYSLTMGYKFFLGVVEISTMYSEPSKKLESYFNLGVSF